MHHIYFAFSRQRHFYTQLSELLFCFDWLDGSARSVAVVHWDYPRTTWYDERGTRCSTSSVSRVWCVASSSRPARSCTSWTRTSSSARKIISTVNIQVGWIKQNIPCFPLHAILQINRCLLGLVFGNSCTLCENIYAVLWRIRDYCVWFDLIRY